MSKENQIKIMEAISKRLTRIREKIADAALRSGRNPDEVEIVGVTKTVPADRVAAAVAAGLRILGGNYIQESLEKIDALSSLDVSWHFIGRLQSNKAKFAVNHFDLIHSVETEKLAAEINRQAAKQNKVQTVLIQVNAGQEATKAGVLPDDALTLVKSISRLENIKIRGLMTMPPYFDDPERARPFFRAVNDLKKRIEDEIIANVSMKTLSMGMTGDFEAAVEEGATLVRIGTAIFGERS